MANNEARFTPGPWVAEEVGVSDMGPNGVPVYEVLTADGHRRIVDAAGEGDALLIAAAPMLIETLRIAAETLTESAKQHRCKGDTAHGAMCDAEASRVRAAIAAATNGGAAS